MSSWGQKNNEYSYQPFIMDGTCEWFVSGWREYEYYNQTISNEDTVISGKTYKKIFSIECGNTTKIYDGAIREANKRVYIIRPPKGDNESKEYIFYDFNLKAGDKFIGEYTAGIEYKVAYIDTIQIEGKWRRRYYFYEAYHSHSDIYLFDSWIEGIGSEQGLLFPLYPVPTGYIPKLECVHQNGIILYREYSFNSCNCNDVQSVNENNPKESFRILQNPVSDNHLSIELHDAVFSKIDIYSWDGKLLVTKKVSISNGILEVPLTNL